MRQASLLRLLAPLGAGGLNLPPAVRRRAAEISGLLLLILALTLGGASQGNAVPLAIVEGLALPALAIGLWQGLHNGVGRSGGHALIVLAAMVGLPLIQLIPLPPDVWTALPGRAGVVAVLRSADLPLAWMPISLTAEDTVHCALALIPPVAMFLITVVLDTKSRMKLAFVAAALALVSVVLGLLQVEDGPASSLRLYAQTNQDSAVGFFANRNHQADFLACAIPLLVGALALTRGPVPSRLQFADLAILMGVPILALGVAVTASRAGLVLIAIAVTGSLIIAPRQKGGGRSARGGLYLALAAGLLSLIAIQAGRVPALARFAEQGADLRFMAAPTVIAAIRTYWPVGSGFGSFIPIYQTLQPPALVDPTIFNHAHDDFLEISLEGGLAAWVILAAFVAWVVGRGHAAWRKAAVSPSRSLARGGTIVIVMILVHSLVDYPLRTVAMTTLLAFACGLLILPKTERLNADGWSLPQVAL